MAEGNWHKGNLVKADGCGYNDYLQDNKEDGNWKWKRCLKPWLRSTTMQQCWRKKKSRKRKKEGSEGGQRGKREKQGVVCWAAALEEPGRVLGSLPARHITFNPAAWEGNLKAILRVGLAIFLMLLWRPHITVLFTVTGRLWRSRLLLLDSEGWAGVWTLPACSSVSRVKRWSFTFCSPGETARQARGSPPPPPPSPTAAAAPTSGCLFAGLLSREWPKRRNRAPRKRRSLPSPALTPCCWDTLTPQVLQIGASFTGSRLTDLMFHLLSVCHQIRGGAESEPAKQQTDWHTDRTQWALRRVRSSRTSPWLQD